MLIFPGVPQKKLPFQEAFLSAPGSRCPRFFTRYVKQAGALPAASAVPWRVIRGHDITALWTRAPFFEMWGKPKDCREPQVVEHSVMENPAPVKPFWTFLQNFYDGSEKSP